MDGDRLPSWVSIDAASGRAANAGNLREVSPTKPGCEVELFSVFTIEMDADVPRAPNVEQMHRIFKYYPLTCFREQGLSVRQDYVSPDFFIEKGGDTCWTEAVTAKCETQSAGGS